MDDLAGMDFYTKHLRILFVAMALGALPVTKIVLAEQYQLQHIADLTEFNDPSNDAVWLQPLASPIDDGFFVAQDNGVIYRLGNEGKEEEGSKNNPVKPEIVLNLPLSVNSPDFISLSAMTLHPSFTLPERLGYATFYTAHTTEFALGKNNNRLTLNDPSIHFAFETVITAWKYDFDKQKIDLPSQREILRIPIMSNDSGIQQMSFSPYVKVWNADYGQLHFSLNSINELNGHALYSGAILRIYPQMFGARNYTVSRANPFVKKTKINNEIVVIGGEDIGRFFWAKNSHESIFIQHNNGQQHWLSKTVMGDDLSKQAQSDYLWKQANTMSSMLFYQGRNFLNLRNKMLFFTQTEQQLHLTSLALERVSDDTPISEEIITTEAVSTHSELNIYQGHKDEIIVFDNHNSRLYSLQSTNKKVNEASASSSSSRVSQSNYYVLFSCLLAALLILYMFIKRNKGAHKLAIQTLNKTYVRFEYDLIKQTILLFRANKGKEHQSLSIENVIRCEVLFNSKVINTFDSEPQNIISNQIDAEIRDFLTQAESDKMLEEQTRQIEIILSDQKASHTICLYLRKGNTRVTGKSYSEVVDMLIELCWIISKRLNPLVTESRIIPVAAFSRPNYAHSAKQPVSPPPTQQDNSHEELATAEVDAAKPVAQTTGEIDVVDVVNVVDVVEALDKLVDLHKQGYLSDEEFSLAKNKLLQ